MERTCRQVRDAPPADIREPVPRDVGSNASAARRCGLGPNITALHLRAIAPEKVSATVMPFTRVFRALR